MTLGEWIREQLIEAGEKGVTVADLHIARRTAELRQRGGTYNSFARFFHWYKQLGFVEETGEVEQSYSKGGGNTALQLRKFFKISSEGESAGDWAWIDPIGEVHPEFKQEERKSRYYTPTGRPRGRPRKYPIELTPPRAKKPKKTKQLLGPAKVAKRAPRGRRKLTALEKALAPKLSKKEKKKLEEQRKAERMAKIRTELEQVEAREAARKAAVEVTVRGKTGIPITYRFASEAEAKKARRKR